jgi:hypothetical protein
MLCAFYVPFILPLSVAVLFWVTNFGGRFGFNTAGVLFGQNN